MWLDVRDRAMRLQRKNLLRGLRRDRRRRHVQRAAAEPLAVAVTDVRADRHTALDAASARARIVAASPAWNPQATFALVTNASSSMSPSTPSPTSAFRSITRATIKPTPRAGLRPAGFRCDA